MFRKEALAAYHESVRLAKEYDRLSEDVDMDTLSHDSEMYQRLIKLLEDSERSITLAHRLMGT